MKKISIDEAKGTLAEHFGQLSGETLILTRDGRPVGALVPLDESDWESVSLSTHPEFMAIIEQSRRAVREKGSVSAAQARKQLLG